MDYFNDPRVNSNPAHVFNNLFSKSGETLPRVIQQHLTRVYSALCVTLLCATLGCIADMRYHFGGPLTGLAGLAVIIALTYDSSAGFTPQVQYNRNIVNGNINSHASSSMEIMSDPSFLFNRRCLYLLGFGFLQGASLGPLISQAIRMDPAIVLTALVSTAVIFICFTLSALYSPRRSYFYLGSVLSSTLSVMLLMSIVRIFYPSSFMFSIELYVGLLVFCGYVLYDTQIIIEKANYSQDFVLHAMSLFVDFVAIFVRILIILMNREQKKEKKQNNRR